MHAAPKGNWPTSELQPVELPQLAHQKGCFAAYYARSIDELSGRTMVRIGYDRPDSAHAIGGTAELALRYSNKPPHQTSGPRHFRVTTGRPDCQCKGNATASTGAAGPFYGTTGQKKQQVAARPPPSCRYRRTFPKTTGRQGAADATDDSAGAAVPARD